MADPPETPAGVVEWLGDKLGQQYVTAYDARSFTVAFTPLVHPDFLIEQGITEAQHAVGRVPESSAKDALRSAIGEAADAAGDSRGLLSVSSDTEVITVADLSAVLVEAAGREPDDSTMLGAGSTSDVRHEKNIETLREVVDTDDG